MVGFRRTKVKWVGCPACKGMPGCPTATGTEKDYPCFVCGGSKFVPRKRCACGRPANRLHPEKGVYWCGLVKECLEKVLEKMQVEEIPPVRVSPGSMHVIRGGGRGMPGMYTEIPDMDAEDAAAEMGLGPWGHAL